MGVIKIGLAFTLLCRDALQRGVSIHVVQTGGANQLIFNLDFGIPENGGHEAHMSKNFPNLSIIPGNLQLATLRHSKRHSARK